VRTAAEVEAARANHKAVWRALLDANTGAHLYRHCEARHMLARLQADALQALNLAPQDHARAQWKTPRL